MHFRLPLSALLLVCLLAPSARAQESYVFPSDSFYADAIAYVRQEGMMVGYADGSFRPYQPINRAEMVKVLMMAHPQETLGSYCFSDVRAEWFARYVCGARDHGMVNGYPDGTFRPAQTVTFAEGAALVGREHEGNLPPVGGSWYMPYVLYLQEIDAVPPSLRSMDAPLSRGDVAYMLWKADAFYSADEPAEDEPSRPDIRLRVTASVSEAEPGATTLFFVRVANEGYRDEQIDIEAELDDALTVYDAPEADDIDDDRVRWEDVRLAAGDEKTFVLIVTADAAIRAGTVAGVTAYAGGEEDRADVFIRASVIKPQTSLGDPVLYWNAVADQALADDYSGLYKATPEQNGPGPAARALAVVHTAIYDAVNSIDRTHQPFRVQVPVPDGTRASADAAVAQAAHQTLVAMYPAQKPAFDIALEQHLNLIPNGPEKIVGLGVGGMAATAILNERASDGWNRVVDYVYQILPGFHRPDPINPNQAIWGPAWGNVRPFVLQSGAQFRAPPPPAIDTPAYAAAFNEAKSMGGDGIVTATQRTPEQTQIGTFWAYDGTYRMGTPPRMYNEIAATIARQQGNDVVQNARYFALIHIAMADAGVASWESKFHYNYWRPIVAIREADAGTGPSGLGDGNPFTAGDPQWTALGAPASNQTSADVLNFTPPFPAYPSGHATFGAALFRTTALFYGTDAIPFTFMSHEFDGVTTDNRGVVRPYAPRSFQSLSQAARENAESRIYLGIHWRFDATAGIDMGNKVAEYVYGNALRPVSR